MLGPPRSRRGSPVPLANAYRYTPFTAPDTIRILTLLPGTGDEPLRGRLEAVSVLAAPKYEAVSYVWGDPRRCTEMEIEDQAQSDPHAEKPASKASITGEQGIVERSEWNVAGTALPSDGSSTLQTLDGISAPVDANNRLALNRSIHDALVRMRLPDRPRTLWADQVCINQDDLAERSQQVRFMNLIYRNAGRVLVWLGRDEENLAPKAVEFVIKLKETLDDPVKAEEFRARHEEGEALSKNREEEWMPLRRLTQLPWFNRMWIAQEIGTAAPATLFWGTSSIDWRILARVSDSLGTYYHLRRSFSLWTPHIRYLYRRFVDPYDPEDPAKPLEEEQKPDRDPHQQRNLDYHQEDLEKYRLQRMQGQRALKQEQDEPVRRNRRDFIYELHRARHLHAKDARDHVYGMLGHFSFQMANRSLRSLQVNYAKSVEDTFIDLAVLELRGARTLILLAAVQHNTMPPDPAEIARLGGRERRARRLREKLPSWVPNWITQPIHLLNEPESPHRAAGDTAARVQVDQELRTVFVYGVKIDVVAARTGTLYAKDFSFASDGGERPATVPEMWRSICGQDTTHGIDLSARYGATGESAFLAYILTLTNGCAVAAARSGRPYRSIPKSEWLPHGAAYCVRALEAMQQQFASGVTEIQGGDPEHPRPHKRTRSDPQGSSSRADSWQIPHKNDIPEPIPSSAALAAAAQGGNPFTWSHEATLVTRNRRFARTEKGYFMIGAAAMEIGDIVCVLFGGKTPFILRPLCNKVVDGGVALGAGERESKASREQRYQLVGECYVHGLMNGEAMEMLKRGEAQEQCFRIV